MKKILLRRRSSHKSSLKNPPLIRSNNCSSFSVAQVSPAEAHEDDLGATLPDVGAVLPAVRGRAREAAARRFNLLGGRMMENNAKLRLKKVFT